MTLKSDAKFEENLASFNVSSGKSGNLHFDVQLLPKGLEVSA